MLKTTWVEIETSKGLKVAASYSYRGQISSDDLAAWIDGSYQKKCIKLDAVHWHNGIDQYTGMGNYTHYGMSQGFENFTGELYLQAEHIIQISIIKDQHAGTH